MKIAYDTSLKRPGCALLQASLGGSLSVANVFDPRTWLLNPTPNMRVYEVDARQLAMLIEITEAA